MQLKRQAKQRERKLKMQKRKKKKRIFQSVFPSLRSENPYSRIRSARCISHLVSSAAHGTLCASLKRASLQQLLHLEVAFSGDANRRELDHEQRNSGDYSGATLSHGWGELGVRLWLLLPLHRQPDEADSFLLECAPFLSLLPVRAKKMHSVGKTAAAAADAVDAGENGNPNSELT
jgi:hypothetical protein